jgi:hypothetical protein
MADRIAFNGVGEGSHESLVIDRKRPPLESWQTREDRGLGFCKTARKPYDLAVTATLAYLSTVYEGLYDVSSDGDGRDWLNGVEAARRALPRWGNVLDIPMGVMQDDRWTGPHMSHRSPGYEFRFCVDGRAYVIRRKDGLARVFDSHAEAGRWAAPHWKEILNPMGQFDEARWKRVGAAQTKLFKSALEWAELHHPEKLGRPPAFVRPDEWPDLPPDQRVNIDDLIRSLTT